MGSVSILGHCAGQDEEQMAGALDLSAYTHDDIVLGSDEQHLIGLINRMRLFAPAEVISGAQVVLKAIVEISLKPSVELRQLALQSLSKRPDPDPFLSFSLTCRTDLDSVRRNSGMRRQRDRI
jgi:hypothetical protein